MEEIWTPVFRILEGFVYGLSVALVINFLIIPMLSHRVRYWCKYACRMVSLSEIRLEMVSKAWQADRGSLSAADMRKKLASHFCSNGCDARGSGDSISIRMGSTTIDVSIYTEEVTEEEHTHLVSGGLELRFSSRCRFIKLSDSTIDLLGSKEKMKEILRGVDFKMNMDFSLVCTTKGMALAKILLDPAKSVTMDYKTKDGHDFELYDDRIVYHGSTMSSERLSLIKKMIVTYS